MQTRLVASTFHFEFTLEGKESAKSGWKTQDEDLDEIQEEFPEVYNLSWDSENVLSVSAESVERLDLIRAYIKQKLIKEN